MHLNSGLSTVHQTWLLKSLKTGLALKNLTHSKLDGCKKTELENASVLIKDSS